MRPPSASCTWCRSTSWLAVAEYSLTGTFTRPNATEPVQIALICTFLRWRARLSCGRVCGGRCAMAKETTTVVVEGRRVRLSSLDKELFCDGTTKGDVIGYYAEIADVLIPHVRGRPVTRKRWVDGTAGEAFFAKQLEPGAPDWLARARIRHSSRVTEYPLVTEPATLVWFAQMAALELHVPQWRFGPDGTPGPPDRLVVDLDPGPGAGLELCVEVAHLARELLDGMACRASPSRAARRASTCMRASTARRRANRSRRSRRSSRARSRRTTRGSWSPSSASPCARARCSSTGRKTPRPRRPSRRTRCGGASGRGSRRRARGRRSASLGSPSSRWVRCSSCWPSVATRSARSRSRGPTGSHGTGRCATPSVQANPFPTLRPCRARGVAPS